MALCNKCQAAEPHGSDSWCLGCAAHEQIAVELKGAWPQPGLRVIASDLVASCLRQIRALKRVSLAVGAGSARPPEPAGPPPGYSAAPPPERERSRAPPREEREGVRNFVKQEEEENEEASGSASGDYEEEEEEEEPTTSAKSKPRPPSPQPRHHEGGSSGHRKEDRHERSKSRGARSELPRLRSRDREHREHRRTSGKRHHEGRKRHRPHHRGGSKHQKLHKAGSDPYRRFHHQQPGSFWDQDHFTRLDFMPVQFREEAWVAVLVTGASRPVAAQSGLVVEGKMLGCEAELKVAEVSKMLKEGKVHLCHSEPCGEALAGTFLHVTRARLWSLHQFDGSYLSKEGKGMLTRLRKQDLAGTSERASKPGAARPSARKQRNGPTPRGATSKAKRKSGKPGKPIEISSEDDYFIDPEEEFGEETSAPVREMLRMTRERIAAAEREAAPLMRNVARPPKRGGGLGEVALKEEALVGSRGFAASKHAQGALRTGATLTPGVASPLALMGPADSSGLGLTGSRKVTKGSKKDPNSILLAQALRQRQASKRKSSSSGKASGLVKALQKAVGKTQRSRKKNKLKMKKKRMKPDPGSPYDDDPEEDEEEESSSKASDSELSFEAPLRKRAAKNPGSVMQMLIKHIQDQMDLNSMVDEGVHRGDALVGGIRVSSYFSMLIRPYFPQGNPLLRELFSLAQTIDLLRSGRLSEAGDSLAARFVSVHTALTEGNWATAAHLEMHPLEPVSSTSTATLLEAQRHRRLVLKSQGYPTSGTRTWCTAELGASGGRLEDRYHGLQWLEAAAFECTSLERAGRALLWLLVNVDRLREADLEGTLLQSVLRGKENSNFAMHRGRASKARPLVPLPAGGAKSLLDCARSTGFGAFCGLSKEKTFDEEVWAALSVAANNGLAGFDRAFSSAQPDTLQNRAWTTLRAGATRALAETAHLGRTPREAEKELASRFLSYTGEEVPKMQVITLKQVEAALPPASHSGSIDALDLLCEGSRQFLLRPEEALRDDVPHSAKLSAKVHIHPDDQLALAKLLVERRICTWTPRSAILRVNNQLVLNGMFAVGKGTFLPSGKEIQRLIMKLVPTNQVFRQAQGAMADLPGITQYLSMVLDGSEEVVFFQSDMSAAFYLFRIPPCWNSMMAFNLSFKGSCLGFADDEDYHLSCAVIPMGWGSSVSIMQEIADRLTVIGRLPQTHKIRRSAPLPVWLVETLTEATTVGKSWYHVYLDNFCAMHRGAPDEEPLEGIEMHRKLEDIWERTGILSSSKKRVHGEATVQELGALIDGRRKLIGGSPLRLLKLVQVTLVVLSKPRLRQKWVQVLVGRWVHVFSFRRPAMILFDEVWKFHSAVKGTLVNFRKVRAELFGACLMCTLLHTDLSASVSPCTTASDASSSGGAVGVRERVLSQQICNQCKDLTVEVIREWRYKYPEIQEVHLWGGFPCVDLSSVKFGRQNLGGAQGGLFWELVRVLRAIRQVYGFSFRVLFFAENVASMDRAAEQEITQVLGGKPYKVDSVDAVPLHRPRFCWTNVEIQPLDDVSLAEFPYWIEVTLAADYPEESQWLSPGATWGGTSQGVALPTCMKSIRRVRPPPRPAGLHRVDMDSRLRWEADEFRFPPYQYDERFIIWQDNKWRLTSAAEREVLHGLGEGHTEVCWNAGSIKDNPIGYEDTRKSLVGDSFNCFSFVYFAAMACYRWMPYFTYGDLVQRMGLAPGFCCPLSWRAPLARALQYGQPPNDHTVRQLNAALLRRVNHTGSDVRISSGLVLNPKAYPRQSVMAQWWLWDKAFAYKWKKSDHINSLELRSIVHAVEWRVRHLKDHNCRVFHVSDSYVCMSIVSKGRSSSRMLRPLLQRLAAWAERARARRNIVLADIGVTPATLQRYHVAVRRLGPTLRKVRTEVGLDDEIAEWIQRQFQSGFPLHLVADALSGLHHFEPWTRRRLPKSWRLYGVWRRYEVPFRAPPLTQDITLAMAGWCLLRGELTMCALLLLGFHALLRTGELLQVRAVDFLLSKQAGLVSLPSSKSGVRNNSKESVSLSDPIVLMVVSEMEYFLKWAPGSETTGKEEDDRRNDRLAKQAIDGHKILGKFLQ
eukprot:Skav212279  [mRNA]  locus=scaffold732:326080:334230:- [translate_table: standard]